jgi:anti-sigma factor RsiW
MNRELQLKLQAYVDGELSGREARRVEDLVAQDPSAKALLAELRFTKAFVSANEPQLALPESREFYWNKIQRAISSQPAATLADRIWEGFLAWRRYLAPVAATALVTLVAVGTINFTEKEPWRLAEVENLSEHTGSFSFRSHAENMFVVWVYEKPDAAQPDFEAPDDEDVMPE